MNRTLFRDNILELIRRTSAFLPPDVTAVLSILRGGAVNRPDGFRDPDSPAAETAV